MPVGEWVLTTACSQAREWLAEGVDRMPTLVRQLLAAGYWNEACFIADVSRQEDAMRVISRFLELQGESLTGGLVFREYVPLAAANGEVQEWRAFVLDGEPLGCWPRFAAAGAAPPPDALVRAVARSIPARFATVDFALAQSGRWLVIEVGEGQVSGIPEGAAVPEIFQALAAGTPNGR